ncbi:transporter substrate-binding domain-containing protein [Thalassomonas viridans]|uniref:Transporter substrate-binding domain-containing protein n=1 Tax=Thalassomonas viridans TaxID=137584 RepID=A0AAE9Z0D6_9GAMM|nr:transporter substrate-binding domain-containing protein [Thalassomonas viridans]WDE03724.1 transporter substrate-binding domain-containing protein [Thalassomonas viridans]
MGLIFKVLLRLVWALFLVIAFNSLTASAQQPVSLNIYTELMPPYQLIDSNNRIAGINIEILRLLLASEGIEHRLELMPWTRAYKAAQANKSGGVISTALTRSRFDKFKWVGPFPASSDGVYLFRRSEEDHIVINTYEDIKKYSLGYVRLGIYEEIFRSKGLTEQQLLGFASSNESYKMLFNGKIDLALGSEITIADSLAIHGFPPDHVVKVFQIKDIGGNYLALNRQVPDELVGRLNLRLKQMRHSRQVRDIINKYSSADKIIWRESYLRTETGLPLR